MNTIRLPEELLSRLPKLYATENQEDPMVQIKFFDPTGFYTWYATEGEVKPDGNIEFFGYVKGQYGELGYFTLHELEIAKCGFTGIQSMPIEIDLYFKPCKLSEVRSK